MCRIKGKLEWPTQLKHKLLLRFNQGQGNADLLAEAIIDLIAVARNDQNAFSAASLELDRRLSLDTPVTWVKRF